MVEKCEVFCVNNMGAIRIIQLGFRLTTESNEALKSY
jgi:hypothetical protein